MAIFVAIGGGEIHEEETLAIDEHIVALCGKRRARQLFIPTASGEAAGYIESVQELYGARLGCECDVLLLLEHSITEGEIRKKIEWADIVYVGGGNTRFMMKEWKKHGVDKILRENADRDKIYSGLSAGSICWFERGISDSDIMENGSDGDYVFVDGLGLVKGCHSPHLDSREAEPAFASFLAKNEPSFLGIENCCALLISGKDFQLKRSLDGKNAFLFSYPAAGQVNKTPLPDRGRMEVLLAESAT